MTAILSLIAGSLLRREGIVDERAFLRELAPDAVFSEKAGTPPHYKSGKDLVAFNSHDVAPSIRGYAGPIKLMLLLGSDGRIKGIKIIEHRETKNYVHYMETPQYLSQYIGKSILDGFEIDKDIDGISRATVSVEAMAKTARKSSRSVALNVFGMNVNAEGDGVMSSLNWTWYLALFSLSFGAYFITRRTKRFLRLRDASMILGIVIIGMYLSAPFSILHVFNLILSGLSSSILWHVIILSTLASVLVAGRFYCGWLCPFGALSEFIGRIPMKKWIVPVDEDDGSRLLKYILLGAVIIIVFLSGRSDYGNYETYVTLFSYHGSVFTWALVIISLVANLRIGRFWCRCLCPVAALTGILSRRDNGYVSGRDCPMANKPNPLISECIRCNRCYLGRKGV